jgi:thiol-disulfide isomerase/thioredoxin
MTVPFGLTAQDIAVVSPAAPKLNDVVTITYDPLASDAIHKEAAEVTAVVLLVHIDDLPSVIEQPMERAGAVWKTSFTVNDPKAVGFLVRFDADETIDDNSSNAWFTSLYGKNGKPVEGSMFIQSLLHLQRNYYGFKRTVDSAKAIAAVKQELKLYPDNWRAQQMLWSIETRNAEDAKTKARIKKELSKVYTKHKNNEEAVDAMLRWFVFSDQSKKADEIESQWLKKNPDGAIAQSKWRQEFFKEQDPAKRAVLADEFLSRFAVKREYANMLISAYIRTKQYTKGIEFLEKFPAVHPNYYNSIAYGMISAGTDVEKAVEIAKKGLGRASLEAEGSRFDYITQTMAQAKKNIKYYRGMIADTYGEGLMKLGRYAEAETVLEESHALIEGDDPDNNARLVECYIKNGKNDKAAAAAYASMVKGKSNDTLVELYKTAYTSVNGSAAGFDSVMAVAKTEAKSAMVAKLNKEKLDRPSIDFELKSLDGSMVTLSVLKGKVVVLDFWATWCGPCLASFPSLQKVYDKYKENPDIVILALNTWERVKPEEREQHVKDFIAKNNYTFPVLFDTDIVFKYGVEGIPTKFIIGKNGNIRFKDVGFGGAQEMVDKMEMQFELLLNEDVAPQK